MTFKQQHTPTRPGRGRAGAEDRPQSEHGEKSAAAAAARMERALETLFPILFHVKVWPGTLMTGTTTYAAPAERQVLVRLPQPPEERVFCEICPLLRRPWKRGRVKSAVGVNQSDCCQAIRHPSTETSTLATHTRRASRFTAALNGCYLKSQ